MEGLFYLLSTKLLALSILVQFIEYFYMRSDFADDGVWSWRSLRLEYDRGGRLLLSPIFSSRGTFVLILLGPIAALGMYARPDLPFPALVFVCCILMAIRFRGNFNGGSDFMTLTVAGALAVAALAGPASSVAAIAFCYVGVQVTLSYFVSGIVKLKEPGWRDGTTLAALLRVEKYSVPASISALTQNRAVMLAGSWGILLFECTFPLALLSLPLLWIYLPVGLLFHAANVAVFGLNRFFFAWLAAYPLLYYSCLRLH